MVFGISPVERGGACRHSCASVMVAEGEITGASPEAFVDFFRGAVADKGLRNILVLNSQGGEVQAALELGVLLRRLGVTVVIGRVAMLESEKAGSNEGLALIPGRCFSACVYMMAGGRQRIVPDFSVLGVHRIHSAAGVDVANRGGPLVNEFADEKLVDGMRRYLGRMGVKPDLMALAESIAPSDIRRLTRQELLRYRLASGKL